MIFFSSRPSALTISWLWHLTPGDRLISFALGREFLFWNSLWLWYFIPPNSCLVYILLILYPCILSHDLFLSFFSPTLVGCTMIHIFFSGLICTREWACLFCRKQSPFALVCSFLSEEAVQRTVLPFVLNPVGAIVHIPVVALPWEMRRQDFEGLPLIISVLPRCSVCFQSIQVNYQYTTYVANRIPIA